jgi:hypothetical protein
LVKGPVSLRKSVVGAQYSPFRVGSLPVLPVIVSSTFCLVSVILAAIFVLVIKIRYILFMLFPNKKFYKYGIIDSWRINMLWDCRKLHEILGVSGEDFFEIDENILKQNV